MVSITVLHIASTDSSKAEGVYFEALPFYKGRNPKMKYIMARYLPNSSKLADGLKVSVVSFLTDFQTYGKSSRLAEDTLVST
jgi:hypothetical protein